MQSYLKTRPVWIQLFIFLGMLFSIITVLSLIATSILGNITGISVLDMVNVSKMDSHNPGTIFYLRGMIAAQFLSFIITCYLFAYFSDPHPLSYLGLRRPSNSMYWIWGIAALILALPLVNYLGLLNRQIEFGPQLQKWIQDKEDQNTKLIEFMISRHTPSELVYNLIFMALFAGIGEELIFRGVLQPLFIRAFKHPWAGILLTALLFSGIHMMFFGFFPRMLLGVLLGAVYWYSGSLLPAMAAHFAFNGFQIALAYLYPDAMRKAEEITLADSSLLAVAALGSALAVALAFWQMKKNSGTTYADIYRNEPGRSNDFTF